MKCRIPILDGGLIGIKKNKMNKSFSNHLQLKKMFHCTFVLTQKYQKINYTFLFSWRKKRNKRTCAEKELLKFHSAPLRENNSLRSNRFSLLTLHYMKFFNAILLRREKKELPGDVVQKISNKKKGKLLWII